MIFFIAKNNTVKPAAIAANAIPATFNFSAGTNDNAISDPASINIASAITLNASALVLRALASKFFPNAFNTTSKSPKILLIFSAGLNNIPKILISLLTIYKTMPKVPISTTSAISNPSNIFLIILTIPFTTFEMPPVLLLIPAIKPATSIEPIHIITVDGECTPNPDMKACITLETNDCTLARTSPIPSPTPIPKPSAMFLPTSFITPKTVFGSPTKALTMFLASEPKALAIVSAFNSFFPERLSMA